MFAKCPAGRPGTADEVANVAELLMRPQGAFITGADFLIDGGATASYFLRSAPALLSARISLHTGVVVNHGECVDVEKNIMHMIFNIKVLEVNGSPRKQWNTATLVNKAPEGAASRKR